MPDVRRSVDQLNVPASTLPRLPNRLLRKLDSLPDRVAVEIEHDGILVV